MKSDRRLPGKEMNNPHRINDAYADFLTDWLFERLSPTKKTYFVTLTFEHEAQRRQRRQAEGLSAGAYEMKAFDHLYNLISRKLVGRNYHRRSHEHRLPHVATFLDAEGSRHWRSSGELTNLHFHSIWIVEGSDATVFEDVMTLNGSLADARPSLSFDAIDVRQFDLNNEGECKRVMAYASKLTGFNNQNLSLGRDFEIYPINQMDRSSEQV